MPSKKVRSLRCPTCRKIVSVGEPDLPFCSDRCRMIDLGKWASGAYVVSSPINDPESGGEAEYTERPAASMPKRRGEGSSDSPPENESPKPN